MSGNRRWLTILVLLCLGQTAIGADDEAAKPAVWLLGTAPPAIAPEVPDPAGFGAAVERTVVDALLATGTLQRVEAGQPARFEVQFALGSPIDEVSTVQAWLMDKDSGRIVASVWGSLLLDVTFSLQAEAMAEELAQAWKELDPAILAATSQQASRNLIQGLHLKGGPDGTTVTLADGRELGTIAEGKLDLPAFLLEKGKSLSLELRRDGYLDKRVNAVPADDGGLDLGSLAFKSGTHLLLSYHLNYLASLGFVWRDFIDADWTWWEAGADLTLFGSPVFDPVTGGERTAVTLYPGLNLGAGSYLFLGPEQLVRTSVGTRLGWVGGISNLQDTRMSSDFYLQALVLGFELNFADFVIRQEMSWRFYLGIGDSALFPPGVTSGFPRIDVMAGLKLPEVRP